MASPHGQTPVPRAPSPTPPAPEAARATSSTQVFGVAPSGPPNLKSTQIFGASQPTPPPSAVPQTTQVFGAAPSQGTASGPPPPSVAPVGTATQVFGAAASPSPGNTTQVFGAVPTATPPPASPKPGGATQVFGAVPPQASGTPVSSATQVFGAVPPQAASTPVPQTTQVFGSAPPRASGTPVSNATQVFGAVPSRASSTPASSATQVFGAVPPQSGVAPTHASAQPPGALAEPRAMPGVGAGRTAIFGAPAASDPGAPVTLPDEPPSPVGSDTLLSFAPTALSSGAQEREATSAMPGPSGVRRAPVELPPELLSAGASDFDLSKPEADRPLLGRLLIPLAVLAGLGLTVFLAYPAWRDRDTGLSVETVREKDRAVALLRRDDAASREQAIQSLRALTTANPKYGEAQSELAVALALQLDDLQAELDRLRVQGDGLRREVAQLERLRTPMDWQTRVNALRDELAGVTREGDPVRASLDARRRELDALMESVRAAPEVEPAAAVAARVKAQAVHAAVTASGQALGLAERLRQVESTPTWSTLARAEYALSSGSPPDTLKAIGAELQSLRDRDPTLMRAYVLGARFALRQRDPASAKALLDELLALNNKHELAHKLLDQASHMAGQGP